MAAPNYRLIRRPGRAGAGSTPELDEHQRGVVEHAGGPLLVLAGPGTGKTTTIVEAVADRVERRGTDPERVLVLTFSRKAAVELRERITARLRRTTREPLALTFHSYAYALLRREASHSGEPPPRLLSGPEQLLEIRRLLHGEVEDGAERWPERLRPALHTRGFAQELRDFLARAAERGLDGAELVRLGSERGRDGWVAAGEFAQRYAERFAIDPVVAYDYAELVRAAAASLDHDDVRHRERSAYDAVFVDEYQDVDPAQEELLGQLAGAGHDLVAVGDPDQSIYGFRGADVRAILEFPTRFPTAAGCAAPVVELRTCRRSGAALLAASRRVAGRLPAAPGGNRHRDLHALPESPPGEVSVEVAATASQEAALVADTLRRAHLLDGVPWSRMAVLVRSAVRQVPVLRRALANAGVPVTVAGDEVPLTAEPGVRPLLAVLRAALAPDTLDESAAVELLTGPIGGTDALGVRRLRRALLDVERHATGEALGWAASGALLVAALHDPRQLLLVEPAVGEPARRVAELLRVAGERAREGATAEEVLWEVWRASGLPERLQVVSLAGGARGAAADRDLDAVVALFDAVARFVDRLPHSGPEVFLDDVAAQEIPGDTLAEQAPAGEAVRILTAHRAKGLEWDVVVVAGVQENTWPDLRLRGSLLGSEELVELDSGGELSGEAVASELTSKLLNEERRLFYVAATRARSRLVVTAVGGDDAEERPSRFLDELVPGSSGAEPDRGTALRWLSLPALVADLRSAVTDPDQPGELRRLAAARLARLARAGVRGAHPREWYAIRELSDDRPLLTGNAPVTVSPSQVELFRSCGLRWLLESAVGARGQDTNRSLGSVIHALASLAGDPEVDDGALPSVLTGKLDDVWEELDFGSVWFTRHQRETAQKMIERFVAWHQAGSRELAGVEQPFDVRTGRVRVRGRVDRLERDEFGRAVVVDLKTGSSKPGDDELDRHPQLGTYQLAVQLDAFKSYGVTDSGGAELVQLGKPPAGLTHQARVQDQHALADDAEPSWAHELVVAVADGMSASVFRATVGDLCSSCPVRNCCPLRDEGTQLEP